MPTVHAQRDRPQLAFGDVHCFLLGDRFAAEQPEFGGDSPAARTE
jgi:hypothetical protein